MKGGVYRMLTYEFKNYGDYEIDTEICGKNDEGGL